MQLVPVEALIKPGEKIDYRVRLFNDRGQLLDLEAERFTSSSASKGRAEIDARMALFTAAKDRPATPPSYVKAKVGDVVGVAPRSRRAAAALEVRLFGRPGADHLGRRPLPQRGFANSTATRCWLKSRRSPRERAASC